MMIHFNGRQVIGIAACLALLVCVGCTGKRGPTGPGSRTVYTGTVPADSVNGFFVAIPSMTLADPPLVSTFVQVSPDEYDELPFSYQLDGESAPRARYASIRDGGVTLWFCEGLNYIIIVIR